MTKKHSYEQKLVLCVVKWLIYLLRVLITNELFDFYVEKYVEKQNYIYLCMTAYIQEI